MLETDRIAIEECLYVINHILEYTRDVKNMEAMKDNSMLYDAVQMNFIVLGESSTKLLISSRDRESKEFNINYGE